mmetsp:Transcript_113931/g.368127  ORF Transcript_113931/g.368127 Transcript_113931/m.368127 type:complete len:350 (-) Transcript_113931:109-1158(-)
MVRPSQVAQRLPHIIVGLQARLGLNAQSPPVGQHLRHPGRQGLAFSRGAAAGTDLAHADLAEDVVLRNPHLAPDLLEHEVLVELALPGFHVGEGRVLNNNVKQGVVQGNAHEIADATNLPSQVTLEVFVANPEDVGVLAPLPPLREEVPDATRVRDAAEDGLRKLLGADGPWRQGRPRRQEAVEGREGVLGVAADVDVLGAWGDVPGPLVGLEDAWLPGVVGVEVLAAIQRQDVPGADLRDLLEVHVAAGAQLVADLRHPGRAALGVGHHEHIRRTRLEAPPCRNAPLGVHAFVALGHELQGPLRGALHFGGFGRLSLLLPRLRACVLAILRRHGHCSAVALARCARDH